GIMQVDPSLDIVAVFPAVSFLRLRQIGAPFIPPSSFGQESIPDLNFFFARLSAMLEAPVQNLFVRATLKRAFRQLIIIDSEKPGASSIEKGWIFHSDEIPGS